MDKTVCAVVVTYNRKELLLECLGALKKQTNPLDAIYLVDNSSMDGTLHILKENNYINEIPPEDLQNSWEKTFIIKNLIDENDLKVHYVRMHENAGGAGGFHEGVKRAYEKGYDWLWLMDDDTVVSPNSLEILLNKIKFLDEKIGFICSKVMWNNKKIHLMNIPHIEPLINDIPFNKYDDQNILLVNKASFVSILLKKEVITNLGLPLKEFFIWGDDVEYTSRITNNSYLGIYAKDSIVYHKTNTNYSANILNDNVENLWKYSFGIRNNLYMVKKESLMLFILNLIYNFTILNFNILKRRNDARLKCLLINTKASLNSIIFRPKIKSVSSKLE